MTTEYEASYFERWADAQWDGSIEALDRSVDALCDYALQVYQGTNADDVENVLCELDLIGYWATRKMQTIAALDPTRYTYLPFDPGQALVAAVVQRLGHLPEKAKAAIVSGAALAQKSKARTLPPISLSEVEQGYRAWVGPRLAHHIMDQCYDVGVP